MSISFIFAQIVQFCTNYAIFDELCEKLRFEVNYVKSQHRIISEAMVIDCDSGDVVIIIFNNNITTITVYLCVS